MLNRVLRTTLLTALALALGLRVAACGGGEQSATPTEPAPAPAAVPEPAIKESPVADAVEDTADEAEHMDSLESGDSMEHGDSMTDGTEPDAEPSEHERGDSVEAPEGMAVELGVELEESGGANLRIATTGFSFAPENVNDEHVAGEGHAHVYVDGEKLGRVYGEWYHLDALEPGAREITVSLNANTHAEYARDGQPVASTVVVDVAESGAAHKHAPDPIEAGGDMSVAMQVELDAKGGYNVRIVPTGFVFTPENVNGDHVEGEGHAHLYVDGEKIARVYGEWFHLDALSAGEHSIDATLNANTHAEYAIEGKTVGAGVTLTAGGDGHETEVEGEPAPDPGTVIRLVGGEPVDGVVKIKVKNGEIAVFTVSSDTPGEVHVHGLDVTKAVGPGQDTPFELETSFEGIFEVELHGPSGDVEIASLVIEP